MGSSKQTTKTKSSSSMNQTTSTPGTEYGQSLLPQAQGLATKVGQQTAFNGDRVAAAPVLNDYVAQWGATPSTFVPQSTATNEAQKVNQTWVDPNAQEGIDAGMAAATANQARIPGITENLYDYWGGIASGGGQNPHLQSVIDAFSTDFNEQQARAANQRAYSAGAEGAFGGTGFQQGEAWANEQAAQAYGSQVAGLRYDDYLNTQQLMQQTPQQLAAIAQLNTLPAEQFARYGGMRQENLAGAAATADENAQRQAYNQWLQAQLTDTQAQQAAAEAQAQWEAQYRSDDARVRNDIATGQAQQASQQAGFDNAYLRWLTEQETLGSQIGNLGSLMQFAGMVPGSTTQGSSNTNSTSTTQQQTSPWQIAASLGGAALQAFAPGGMFSGSASALGGGTSAASAMAPTQFSALPSLAGQMPWVR